MTGNGSALGGARNRNGARVMSATLTFHLLGATGASAVLTVEPDVEPVEAITRNLDALDERQTVEVSQKIESYARTASVVRTPTEKGDRLDVTFGTWQRNAFKPEGPLVFDVSVVQPSKSFKSAKGAARAIAKWLGGER